MSKTTRSVLPAIALVLLGLILALPGKLPLIPLTGFAPQEFAAILVIFALLAAMIERAVEILMLLRFKRSGPAEAAFQAARSAVVTELAVERQRLSQADTAQERLAVIESWNGQALGERKRQSVEEKERAKPVRTLWALLFSILLAGVLAANGLLLVSQLINLAAVDASEALDNWVLLWIDAVLTTLVLAGGAEWFHRQIARLNPADPDDLPDPEQS